MSAWDKLIGFFGGNDSDKTAEKPVNTITMEEKDKNQDLPEGYRQIIQDETIPEGYITKQINGFYCTNAPVAPANPGEERIPEKEKTAEQPGEKKEPVPGDQGAGAPAPKPKKSIFEMDENNAVDFKNLVSDFTKPKHEFTGEQEDPEAEQPEPEKKDPGKAPEAEPEKKKSALTEDQILKRSKASAKSIIKSLDFASSNGAMLLAGERDNKKYKIDQEDEDDLMEVWTAVMEVYEGGSTFVLWFAVIVLTLFAFGGKLWLAWNDRKEKNKNKPAPAAARPVQVQQPTPPAPEPGAAQPPGDGQQAGEYFARAKENFDNNRNKMKAIVPDPDPGAPAPEGDKKFKIPPRPGKGRYSAYEKDLVELLKEQQRQLDELKKGKAA